MITKILRNCCGIIIGLGLMVLPGCQKNGPANYAYVGIYHGYDIVDVSNNLPDYYGSIRILASGVNANQITVVDSIFNFSLNGTIDGDFITHLTGSTLAITTGCATETFQGSGSLNGNNINYTIYGSYPCNGYILYDTLSFTGTRQ